MNQSSENFQGWIASLSNGYNVYEGTPLPGQKSSWQQFIDYIQSEQTFEKDVYDAATGKYNKVTMPIAITRMHLRFGNKNIFALPAKQCDGYYCASEYRKSILTNAERLLRGIGSVVGNLVFITWVDENGEITQDIRELETSRPHTTLRMSHAKPTGNEQRS